jgi:L-alanine-DL-glutamate epimerase-like enolase superfamily enzyme
MAVMNLRWYRRVVHLHHPFNIAGHERTDRSAKEVLLCEIEAGGHVGYGEAAPVRYYGQSIDSAEAAFANAATLLGDDPFALEAIHARLRQVIPDQPAAIAAIDGALHDLIGKQLGVPVWRWLGLSAEPIPTTSFTIGIDDPAAIEARVREAAEFPILKIKVGTPQDRAVLDTVRRMAPGKTLRVDANGAWTPAQATEAVVWLATYGVELIEQPLPASDDAAMPDIRAVSKVPIVADESCHDASDVLRCTERFDAVNIKLSKCGGIRPAWQMIHMAHSIGLRVMLGCMAQHPAARGTGAWSDAIMTPCRVLRIVLRHR